MRSVLCYDVRYDFRIQTMFGLSLSSVFGGVCVSLVLFSSFYLLFIFVLCIACSMLSVSLDCQFSIVPSICSNVYLHILSSSGLLWYLICIYCISSKSVSGMKFSVGYIIHCKLPLMVIVGTKEPKYLHGIHI